MCKNVQDQFVICNLFVICVFLDSRYKNRYILNVKKKIFELINFIFLMGNGYFIIDSIYVTVFYTNIIFHRSYALTLRCTLLFCYYNLKVNCNIMENKNTLYEYDYSFTDKFSQFSLTVLKFITIAFRCSCLFNYIQLMIMLITIRILLYLKSFAYIFSTFSSARF